MLAPMILQVQAGGGGGEGKWPLKKHNQYLEGRICRDNGKPISLYTMKLVPPLLV
jgi:hypothetical protein